MNLLTLCFSGGKTLASLFGNQIHQTRRCQRQWPKTFVTRLLSLILATNVSALLRKGLRDFLLRAKAVLKIPKKMKNERPRPRLTAVHPELCDCTSDSKVPDAWVDFLLDQCGPRKQGLAGVKRRRLKLEES